jgi:hypothetical protein
MTQRENVVGEIVMSTGGAEAGQQHPVWSS